MSQYKLKRIRVMWCWYNLWVGAYWDRWQGRLYICPLPTICIRIEFL